MKSVQLDTNHVVEALELLNKVEGGMNDGAVIFDPSRFTNCNFFVCGIALYGTVIDPIRFESMP
jgi:hypothetical protein